MKRPIEQYARFLTSGVFVGVASLAFFELARHLLGIERLWTHAVIVSLTYLFGALLSYRMQQRFVFARRLESGVASFAMFFAITVGVSALVGALATALLAWPALRAVFRDFAPAVTLAAAALAISPFSFRLTQAFFEFRARRDVT